MSRAQFEDEREQALVLRGETAAFHQRHGRVRVAASSVRHLAGLVHVETVKGQLPNKVAMPAGVSDSALRRMTQFIQAELEKDISRDSRDRLAKAADLPLRSVFDGIRSRTGLSPCQFVINARLACARHLLERSDEPISEIALAYGFASQQHLTATMSSTLGSTPGRLRQH